MNLNRDIDKPRPGGFVLLAVSFICVATLHWPAVLYGFFYLDDFILMTQARDIRFERLLLTPHFDHLMPLLRLESWLLVHWGNCSPRIANAFCALVFALCLWAAGLLLREASVRPPLVFAGVALLSFHAAWPIYLNGYATIVVYLIVSCLAMLSALLAWRWGRHGNSMAGATAVGLSLIAAMHNMSGLWAFACAGTFFLGGLLTRGTCSPRNLVAGALAFGVPFVGFAAVDRHFRSSLATQEALTSTWHVPDPITAILGLAVFPTDLCRSLFVPKLNSLSSNAVAGILPIALALLLVVLIVAFTVGAFIKRHRLRWFLLALIASALAFIGMVMLGGRSHANLFEPIPHKYSWGFLFMAAIFSIVALDLLLRTTHRKLLASSLMALLASCYLMVQFSGSAQDVVSLAHAEHHDEFHWPGHSHVGEVYKARMRSQAVDDLSELVLRVLEHAPPGPVEFPTLPGINISSRHPFLNDLDLSLFRALIEPKGSRARLLSNAYNYTWQVDTEVVSSLRESTPVWFFHMLDSSPLVASYYLRDLNLHADPATLDPANRLPYAPEQTFVWPSGVVTVAGDRPGRIMLHAKTIDPESIHMLSGTVTYHGPALGPVIDVIFQSSLGARGTTVSIPIHANKPTEIHTSLLAVIHYALSDEVGSLAFQLPNAGEYRFSSN